MTLASRDEAVETIRRRIDIVEVVSRYVKLKKAGSNFIGLCPFHAEKTPSFTVSPQKGFFHCFGCKASGDIFSFLQKVEGKTFPEALEELATRAGVELPERSPREKTNRELGQRLLEINEIAAAFYEKELWGARGAGARRYLAERNCPEKSARAFRLGYAPQGWQNLADHLRQKEVSLQEAQGLGLLAEGRQGLHDVFRDRIVFPILGLSGKVSGFGARKMDPGDNGPKYINSRQSRVFDKSEILYGLYQARSSVQAAGEVILVEGYFDVLTPVAAGIENVVATCGTALTDAHARILRRFTTKVINLYDADEAGVSASYRAVETLFAEDLSPYLTSLTSGDDPDSYVRKEGAEKFRRTLAAAKPAIEVLAEWSLKGASQDLELKTAALRRLLPILAACPDPLRQGGYLQLLAGRFGVDEGDLRQALRALVRREKGPAPVVQLPPPAQAGATKALLPEEETCLVLLLRYPRLAAKVAGSGIVELFESELTGDLVRRLLGESGIAVSSLLSGVTDDVVRGRLAGLVVKDDAFPEDRADSMLEDSIRKLRLRHIKGELQEIQDRIQQASRDGREEERRRLTQNKIRLSHELEEVRAGKPA